MLCLCNKIVVTAKQINISLTCQSYSSPNTWQESILDKNPKSSIIAFSNYNPHVLCFKFDLFIL